MASLDSKTLTVTSSNGTSLSRPTDEQRNQAVQSRFGPAIQQMYSLAIYDTQTKSIYAPKVPLDPAHTQSRFTSAEYFFRVPPRVHEMGEPFATQITATQNGGKYVESQGVLFRDIRIQGTTGLRPNKLTRDAIPFLKEIPIFGGAVSGAVDGLVSLTDDPFASRGLPNPAERTGYDDIIFLRNLFRAYGDRKGREDAGRYLMLWFNGKDADYWVVEPIDFKLSQDASSPMTYEYSINLKTLSRFDYEFDVPKDDLSFDDKLNAIGRRMGEVDRVLKSTLSTINNSVNKVEGIGVFLVQSVSNPLISVLRGIQSIRNTVNNFGNAFLLSAQTANNNIDEALLQLRDLPTQDPLPRALRRAKVQLGILLSDEALVDSPTKDARKRRSTALRSMAAAKNSLLGSQFQGRSSPVALQNNPISDSVGSFIVPPGATIRSLAKRLLGNAGKWKALVLLNNLTAPFVSETGSRGVLRPGDTILYSNVGTVASTASTSTANPSSAETEEGDASLFSPAEQAYGRDLRLKSSRDGQVLITDLATNQFGDISTIAGIPNVDQALKIKFSTVPGELTLHPSFGAKFAIGKKLTVSSFNTFRIASQSTLLSDPRVVNIAAITFRARGDVFAISTQLDLRESGSLNSNFTLGTSGENFV